jgi:1-acyl-sn-glycerol-3-phosphate acyltransferase
MSAVKSRFKRSVRGFVRLAKLLWVILSAGAAFRLLPRHRRDLAGRAHWLQQTCRRALRALNVDVQARGLPTAPTVVVANHLGYLDILVLAALSPVVFVAKREVQDWPVFGWFARMAGTRFIDRESRRDVQRVADELRAPLESGVSVVLFLEGTSTAGEVVRPFKSSLLEPVVRHGWAVTPVALSYEVSDGHSVSHEVCWWGDMTLTPHLLNFVKLPRITAHVTGGAPVRGATDRKTLAAALHARVVELRAMFMHAPTTKSSANARPAALAVVLT